jgi:UDP-GlcNAc:undecaprenyl-phosphate GlcNAc-1-phosphate transferase
MSVDGEILIIAGGLLGLAALVSFVGCGVVIKLARKWGWVDDPEEMRKIRKAKNVVHEYPVPRLAGLPIFVAVFVIAGWALVWDKQGLSILDKHWWGIVLGAGLTVVVGLIDDVKDLSPGVRLLTNILAAGLVVGAGIGIAFMNNPLGGGVIDLSWPRLGFWLLGEQRSIWILSDLFALVWIVGLMNVVGWSSGVDGQLPGVVGIAAVVIGLLSLQFSADVTQWPVIVLAAVTAGAYLGFLPWNFFPQKMMPGYSGKSLAGFLLAVMAILSTTKVGTVLVVLGVPMVDGLFTVTRRIAKGKLPWWGDRGHLHHRLLDRGWGRRRIAVFYWGITAGLGGVALQLNSQQKLYTMVVVGLAIGLLITWLSWFKIFSRAPDRGSG